MCKQTCDLNMWNMCCFLLLKKQCIFGLMRPKGKTFRAVSYIRIGKTTGYMCRYRTFYYVARNNGRCVFANICNDGIGPRVCVVNGAIVNKCETRNTAGWRIFWRLGHICIFKTKHCGPCVSTKKNMMIIGVFFVRFSTLVGWWRRYIIIEA